MPCFEVVPSFCPLKLQGVIEKARLLALQDTADVISPHVSTKAPIARWLIVQNDRRNGSSRPEIQRPPPPSATLDHHSRRGLSLQTPAETLYKKPNSGLHPERRRSELCHLRLTVQLQFRNPQVRVASSLLRRKARCPPVSGRPSHVFSHHLRYPPDLYFRHPLLHPRRRHLRRVLRRRPLGRRSLRRPVNPLRS